MHAVFNCSAKKPQNPRKKYIINIYFLILWYYNNIDLLCSIMHICAYARGNEEY